jgi:hypothetical protein
LNEGLPCIDAPFCMDASLKANPLNAFLGSVGCSFRLLWLLWLLSLA